jgi:hypothetical protein
MKAFIAAILVTLGLSAFAQEGMNPQVQTPQQEVKIDEQTVDMFANAVVKVEDVQKSFQAQVESKGGESITENEMRELEQDFQVKAQETIEKEGLSVEEYSNLVLLAQQNQEFRSKVVDKMQNK